MERQPGDAGDIVPSVAQRGGRRGGGRRGVHFNQGDHLRLVVEPAPQRPRADARGVQQLRGTQRIGGDHYRFGRHHVLLAGTQIAQLRPAGDAVFTEDPGAQGGGTDLHPALAAGLFLRQLAKHHVDAWESAEHYLQVTREGFPATAIGRQIVDALNQHFASDRPPARLAQPMPLACAATPEGKPRWSGVDVVLGELAEEETRRQRGVEIRV